MRRIDRIRSGATAERLTLDGLAQQINEAFKYGGLTYPSNGVNTTWTSHPGEPIGNSFSAYVDIAYKGTGPVFSAVSTRQRLLSEVRFQYQSMIPRPGALFGGTDLSILENPWPGGTTSDLITLMEAHNSLGGSAMVYRHRKQDGSPKRLHVLRPDWTTILVGTMNGDPEHTPHPSDFDADLLGYIYQPGGIGSGEQPIHLDARDVAHWAPIPDPLARYRGMSWITPVVREIMGDRAATFHKLQFFENAATPNLAIRYPKEIGPDTLNAYLDLIDQEHKGAQNAYKTLHIGGGGDPVIVGANMQQLDFKVTQGAGETRIASASGIPAVILGMSEGLEAATYSNYGQARRLTGDAFLRPMWRSLSGALAQIVEAKPGARLWYDAADVSFLQEDEKDAAEIIKEQALTIESLIRAGYAPDSVTGAVTSGDLASLEHTGLYSVQLQPPGANDPAPAPAA